jgi:hypothetical protein
VEAVAEEVEAVAVLAPEAVAQAPRPARVQPCPSPVLKRATTMVPASLLPALTVAGWLVVAARQRRRAAARQVEVRCPHRWPPGLLALKAGYCMRPR